MGISFPNASGIIGKLTCVCDTGYMTIEACPCVDVAVQDVLRAFLVFSNKNRSEKQKCLRDGAAEIKGGERRVNEKERDRLFLLVT